MPIVSSVSPLFKANKSGIRREPVPVSCKDLAVWLFPDQPEQPGRAIRLSGKIMKNLIPQINTIT